ncbi:MAG: hypothetical protein IID32_06460 [Planctomycetes bacterium]|nr:hypothetical protein [Planctomycetota bacterium]
MEPSKIHMNRRSFLEKSSVALAGASLVAPASQVIPSPLNAAVSRKDLKVGIQIGAVSFVDEGEKQVLDNVQELAKVNTLFLPVFAYNRGLAGRGYLDGDTRYKATIADHGLTDYKPDWFHGGYYATPHMQYYKNTVFKNLRAPEFGDYDMLAAVIPEAKKRGMKVYAMMADNFRKDLPNAQKLLQVDLRGKKRSMVCFNNPEFQGFLMGLIEDCVRSYDIDGLLWRSEKTGPLSEVMGLSHSSGPKTPGCFCSFCQKKAKEQGINFERSVEGYLELQKFTKSTLKGTRPVDGCYTTFWRILLTYPEILQWQNLFTQSLRDTYRAIYALVKSIKSDLPAGWGFSSQQIYSHLFRAEAEIKVLSEYTDFLKFYTYYTAGGPRTAKYIDRLSSNLLADVPREQLLQFEYKLMGYGDEGTFDELRRNGFSDDYVYRETKRALNGAEGTKIRMWPAIDINLPHRRYWPDFSHYPTTDPEGLKKAIYSVFRAGSDRILLARKYSEMQLTNLKAAGDALEEIG